jgi:hypothetical protein
MSFFGSGALAAHDASLDAKIEALRQAAGEDVAVYDFGATETYDGLGDSLDETANDLNDETFGAAAIGAHALTLLNPFFQLHLRTFFGLVSRQRL